MPVELTRFTPNRQPRPKASGRHVTPFVTCPYCSRIFGPWGHEAIEPCPICKRPLHRALGWQRRPQIVSLLTTINAMQGIGMMVATGLFILGPMSLHQLCGCVALALFVAATSYIVDGALAWQSRISRSFGQILIGHQARVAGAVTMLFGTTALLLSLMGLVFLICGPR